MVSPTVQVYASRTNDYHDAFRVFLNHTDQKTKAREFLNNVVSTLPRRRVFLDAGAGNGAVTAWFTGNFERTLAIEPNNSLRAELSETCPAARVLDGSILEARLDEPGDLVLCSHVLYYIEGDRWMEHVERLASWLSAEGTLIVIIQHHDSDCMKMLQSFFGHHYNLSKFAEEFRKKHSAKYDVRLDVVPAFVATNNFDAAYTVAEFMLNLVPITDAPPRARLESYIRKKFEINGGYRFSCNQSFLQIRQTG